MTGAAGYVGSHVLAEVLAAGHAAHALDNLVGGPAQALERVRAIAGRDFGFSRIDIRDRPALARLVADFGPEAVIHCAALKSPFDSLARPAEYADVNVEGTRALLAALAPSRCRRIVFSSSAAVYGPPDRLPIDESHALRPTTPYGETKAAGEALFAAAARDGQGLSVAILRYFNPAGAHPSGRIGEQPSDPPSNLVPAIAEVALGRRPVLEIHGDDYPTRDGTGVRDYLHVMDLARAHIAALGWTGRSAGAEVFNLGTGAGVSVLEAVAAFERASGGAIPLAIRPRRPGDVAACYADPAKAGRVLGWRAGQGLEAICASAWAWARANPEGFRRHSAEIGGP
ncbi:UDP-glucose 4-epimerase GalE [Amaricoccus sp.]|uniref:UDP-glucose 4-epimerase GalE n=1 Tax=Amaricoccus sp. TaxID=1872485 RepID=UPI002D1FBDEA|nr:UDP-glucose 4-epimerase GalE [Amaricoccus sp.]